MKKRRFIVYILISLIIVGCQGLAAPATLTPENASSRPLITPTDASPSLTAEILVTITATPQATLTPVLSPTIVEYIAPTVTPLTYPAGSLQSICLEDLPELPPNIAFKGTIVFESHTTDRNGIVTETTHLFNLAKNEWLQGEYGARIMVSPNRQWMAFSLEESHETMINYRLVIADASGKRLQTLPREDAWVTVLRWTDNEHLVISLKDTSGIWHPKPLLLLNPFTNERQHFQADFPDFLATPLVWDQSGWWGVTYDPALTMAVYPRYFEDDGKKFTFALWDLAQQKLVVSLEDTFFYYSVMNDIFLKPQWAPDGSQFVFRNLYATRERKDFELYRVTRDGLVEQLTHLGEFASIKDGVLSWSPDGSQIALFISTPDMQKQDEVHLAILEIATGQITDTCVWFREKPIVAELLPPIWSPHGKQIVVGQTQGHNGVLLLDLEQGFVVQIAEDIEPVGWMVPP